MPPAAPLTAITNTTLLLNGTNAGIYDLTTINDIQTIGNAQISTTTAKFGTGSMYFTGSSTSYLQVAGQAVARTLAFSTGDFTVELWVNFAANNSTYNPFIRGDTSGQFDLGYDASAALLKYSGSSTVISASWTPSLSTWYHVAVARSSGTSKLFVNGTQVGSTATGDTNNYTANDFKIGGSSFSSSHLMNGYMDEIRITMGYARYTANFTAPTAAFPTF